MKYVLSIALFFCAFISNAQKSIDVYPSSELNLSNSQNYVTFLKNGNTALLTAKDKDEAIYIFDKSHKLLLKKEYKNTHHFHATYIGTVGNDIVKWVTPSKFMGADKLKRIVYDGVTGEKKIDENFMDLKFYIAPGVNAHTGPTRKTLQVAFDRKNDQYGIFLTGAWGKPAEIGALIFDNNHKLISKAVQDIEGVTTITALDATFLSSGRFLILTNEKQQKDNIPHFISLVPGENTMSINSLPLKSKIDIGYGMMRNNAETNTILISLTSFDGLNYSTNYLSFNTETSQIAFSKGVSLNQIESKGNSYFGKYKFQGLPVDMHMAPGNSWYLIYQGQAKYGSLDDIGIIHIDSAGQSLRQKLIPKGILYDASTPFYIIHARETSYLENESIRLYSFLNTPNGAAIVINEKFKNMERIKDKKHPPVNVKTFEREVDAFVFDLGSPSFIPESKLLFPESSEESKSSYALCETGEWNVEHNQYVSVRFEDLDSRKESSSLIWINY